MTLTFNLKEVKGQRFHFNMIQHLNNTARDIKIFVLKQSLNRWCYRGIYTGFPGLFWFPLPNSFLLKKIISNEYFPNLYPLFPIKCPWLLSMFFLLIRMQLTSFFLFNFVLSMFIGPIWGWLALWVVSLKETLKSPCILT